MTPEERYRRLQELFEAARELEHAERESFLAGACGPDAELRAEVESLLAHEDPAGTLGTRPPRPWRAARHLDAGDPAQVGPYKILDVLGEGGFGVVYLAERREPMVQRVALKIIKPGMDSRGVLARFEQERQALAVMDHPNVARVYDAGTTGPEQGGRPYFVMEHVAGEAITGYCDRNKLTVRQRLELFIPVCEAVQHAHMKGIIHRDLKPSNVLVTVKEGAPIPKVIDFGVAKAIVHTMTAQTIFTEQGQIIGTPEYMSPEQAEMGAVDIDTRTDVYSLGVMLYELLTGAVPFAGEDLRSKGFAEIQRIIREVDPPRPSTRLTSLTTPDERKSGEVIAGARRMGLNELSRELRRELEWIPLRAMRKDRTERYRTAMELADDVRNYLDGRPLIAGPESVAYQLKKLVTRYRGPVAAVAAVLLTLLLGLGGTIWQARRAADRAVAAEKAETEQRRLANSEAAARRDADEKRALAERKTAEAATARDAADHQAYVASLYAADASLVAGEPRRARARLDACPSPLRGWEWHWLDARADNSLVSLVVVSGHQGGVKALSPDGSRLITASIDATARLWDASNGKELTVLRGHEGRVLSAAFSPDGALIATGSDDATTRLWDAISGKQLGILGAHKHKVSSVAFSPDGARVITGSADLTARIWDTTTYQQLAVLGGHTLQIDSCGFSPDGTRVITASMDRTSRLWDAASGKELVVLRGHDMPIQCAAFSPDGALALTASWDKTARIWDAVSGTELGVLLGHGGIVTAAAFSPDGARIVTGSDDATARLWDATSGRVLAEFRGHERALTSACFSADATRVITASRDTTVRLWDVNSEAEPTILRGHLGGVTSAAFSPDGSRIVTASADMSARLWDTTRGKELALFLGHEHYVTAAAFSPDGTRVITAGEDYTARIWDAITGQVLAVMEGHAPFLSAAFGPDGTRIVTGGYEAPARIWDAVSGHELMALRGHGAPVAAATFSRDGTRIVTASYDSTARVWDVVFGVEVAALQGHESGVADAAFSPDGTRIVTASHDSTARVWDVVSGVELMALRGHESGVTDAAFSPDGTRIVTASNDSTARVWDATTGEELATLRGHEFPVSSASFSPDGTSIVTASGVEARIWHSLPYRERFPAIDRARRAEARMAPLVESLVVTGQTLDQVASRIVAGDFTPEECAAGLAEVCRRSDHTLRRRGGLPMPPRSAAGLNNAAWNAVRFAPVVENVARQAVAKARRAVELERGNGLFVNTLGVALYRAGELTEALETLTCSAEMNAKTQTGDQPADWAFIAMARWRLNRPEEARTALARLRELAAQGRWTESDETKRWLEEAESLIREPPP